MTADEFFKILAGRRSVREFLDEPVPRDVLERLIEAASLAPSPGNRQDWRFTVVTSSLKKEMSQAVAKHWKSKLIACDSDAVREIMTDYLHNFTWFSRAPVLMVVSCKKPESFLEDLVGDLAADVAGARASACMAAQNIMTAAFVLGLGSCCLTGPLAAQEELKELLGIGRRMEIVCLIALGRPAESPAAPPRKPVSEIVRFL